MVNGEYIVNKKKLSAFRKEIIAILPAFNEEIAIRSMVLGARKYADGVILIDDGSRDKTVELANFAGRIHVSKSFNRGE